MKQDGLEINLRPSTTKNSNRNISFNAERKGFGSNGSKIESDEELDKFPTNADNKYQSSDRRSIMKEGSGQNENEKK